MIWILILMSFQTIFILTAITRANIRSFHFKNKCPIQVFLVLTCLPCVQSTLTMKELPPTWCELQLLLNPVLELAPFWYTVRTNGDWTSLLPGHVLPSCRLDLYARGCLKMNLGSSTPTSGQRRSQPDNSVSKLNDSLCLHVGRNE